MLKMGFIRVVSFFSIALIVIIANSCTDEYSLFTDDFELNNQWEETTIVYANFNISDKIHMIRVNRGFAAGDFFDVQSIQDSIQYQPGELEVFFHKLYKGDTIATYECYDTLVEKEDGEFFNTGKVLMYAFRDPNLIGSTVDDLEFLVEVKTPKGNSVWAVTNPIADFSTFIPAMFWTELGFGAKNFRVEFYAPINSQVYVSNLNIGYKEFRQIDNEFDTVQYYFSIRVGYILEGNPSSGYLSNGQAVTKVMSIPSASIYKALSSAIENNGDLVNTKHRKFTGMTLEIVSGNNDLAMAASTVATTSGFSDNLGTYSNVINGLGYVSCHSVLTKNFTINDVTVDSVKIRFPEYRFVH